MTESERKDLSRAIAMMAETFRQQITPLTIAGYLGALDDLDCRGVMSAIRESMRSSKFMPSPAELRDFCPKPPQRPALPFWQDPARGANRTTAPTPPTNRQLVDAWFEFERRAAQEKATWRERAEKLRPGLDVHPKNTDAHKEAVRVFNDAIYNAMKADSERRHWSARRFELEAKIKAQPSLADVVISTGGFAPTHPAPRPAPAHWTEPREPGSDDDRDDMEAR